MPTYACECKWECACVCECLCCVLFNELLWKRKKPNTKAPTALVELVMSPMRMFRCFFKSNNFPNNYYNLYGQCFDLCPSDRLSLSLSLCGLWLYGPAEWLFNWCSSQRLTTNIFRLPQFSYYFQFWPLTRIECGSILVKILLFDSLSVVRNRIEWNTLVIEVGIP